MAGVAAMASRVSRKWKGIGSAMANVPMPFYDINI
jgi:hypothetical protein